MPDFDEARIEQAIEDNAAGPRSVSVDGQHVEQHSLDDQIKAYRFMKSNAAADRNHRGVRFNKIQPGDAS